MANTMKATVSRACAPGPKLTIQFTAFFKISVEVVPTDEGLAMNAT